MASFELKHVQRFKDRHGKARHYFRRPGYPKVALHGEVGSAEFMAAYQMAMASKAVAPAPKAKPGSISALLVAYYQSAAWSELKPQTQANYRNILERFRAKCGDLSAGAMTAAQVAKMLDAGASKPGATRNLIKRLRSVYAFALSRGMVALNPFAGAKLPREGNGFRAWTEDDIVTFVGHWQADSRAYLALILLLYTGQRRSDVVRMGRQHLRDGAITVTQAKGRLGRAAVTLDIPVHPTLKAGLDALPRDNLTFLMTAYGKPMSPAGFTNWFTDCAEKAGLPQGSGPHGLRKAAARRLAEAGCSPHQIAAITGHKSLREVERYTESAGQKRMAKDAMAKLQAVK